MKRLFWAGAGLIFWTGLALGATSGNAGLLRLVFKEHAAGLNEHLRFHRVTVGDPYVRVDTDTETFRLSRIFDLAGRKVVLVDHGRQVFATFTSDELRRVEKQFGAIFADLSSRKEALTEIEKGLLFQLQPIFSGQQEGVLSYRQKAADVLVRRWQGILYEGSRDGRKKQEVVAVSWRMVAVSQEDVKPLGRVRNEFPDVGLVRDRASRIVFGLPQGRYDGFPVRVTEFEDDKGVLTVELLKITRVVPNADTFEAPASYRSVSPAFFLPELPAQ